MKTCLLCEGVTTTDQPVCSSCGTPLLATSEVHFPVRRGEEDAAHPWIGMRIDGKYRLTSVLGKGGMGTVFRAVHEVSLIPVALKLLHPRFAQKSENRSWFFAEARKAGRVIHENTARVQDVGEAEDGTIYIAMELVQGVTLHEWMRSEVPSVAVVVEILHQLCSALVAAHEVGLVHRDLTPRNIMVTTRDGRITTKILDFGISKGMPMRRDPTETSSGAPVGFVNPPYSAPEHLLGQDVDPRADLYSLGVIAYELLSGSVPVAGRGQVALASATIAGHLVPLAPRTKVPQRLTKLVMALLAREPKARPASATEVKRSLERLRDPGRAWLSTTALIMLSAAIASVVLSYSRGVAPFLRSAAGSEVVFQKDPPPAEAPPRWCNTTALHDLHFDYGGFEPDALRLDVFQRGKLVRTQKLSPEPEARAPRLMLSRRRDPGLGEVLAALPELSRTGALDLMLSIAGHAPLGYTRLRVDDVPPVAECWFEYAASPSEGVLCGSSRVSYRVDDDFELAKVEVRLSGPALGGDVVRVLPLAIVKATKGIDALDVFGAVFPGIRPFGRVELRVHAEDLAGNATTSPPLAFVGVDLRVPNVLSAGAPEGGRTLTFGSRGARLRLRTSGMEERLAVLVEGPDGVQRTYTRPEGITDSGLEILLLPPDTKASYLDGTYEIRLADPAGNVSEPFRETFTFRTEETRPALGVPERAPPQRAVIQGERLIVDGTDVGVEFTCNPLYRPERARVRPARPPGAVALEPGPVLEESAEGRARVRLPALPAGEFVLELELADPRGEAPRQVEYKVTSIPAAPVLKLPEAPSSRFLYEFVQAGLLRVDGGKLRQGDAWRLVPPDASFVRGRLFHGQQQLAQVGTTSPEAPDGALAEGLPLVDGENTLAIALVDLLGRRVAVQSGDVAAPLVRIGEDEVAVVARFWNAATIAVPRLLLLEHGKPARLELRTALPFREETDRGRIELAIEGAPLGPTRIGRRGDYTILEFVVPFERVAAAAKLQERTPAEFAAAKNFELPARLLTPAGAQRLTLEGRTIRSVLQTRTLEEIATDPGRLPQELRGIRMVPVPRQIAGAAWRDPVPATVPGRAALRPDPEHDVRNLGDVYLQRGELTRAQYAAVVRWLLMQAPATLPPASELVHAADPLRAERLSAKALAPLAARGDTAQLARWVAEGPDRPVTGIDWFQAFTVTRIVAALLGGPDLVRLPLGTELERGALASLQGTGALHGALDPDRALVAAHRDWQTKLARPSAWPPTEAESEAAGDYVTTELGDRLVALDFGVREWTGDLPYVQEVASSALVLEWLGDAARHLEHANEFASGVLAQQELAPVLAIHGVVRGVASGEVREIVPVTGGATIGAEKRLAESVPGVARTTYLRRDGSGLLPGEPDPRLEVVGFRLSGGESFVTKARQR